MSMIAIIPARGGSKRIKGKNTKDFFARAIISYSIEAAKKSKIFDEVIVSTDDTKIARVAKKYGASVPSLRSQKSSTDHSTLVDVMLEEICKLEKRGIQSEYICFILATAPTITPQELVDALETFKKSGADTLVCVCEFSEPLERAFKLENGFIKMAKPKNKFTRTQDLQKMYFDAGRFYWVRVDAFKKNKSFFTQKTLPYIVPGLLVQDIDTIDDWRMMELKYKLFINDKKAKNH
jgi:N-acylneuraminate cytidylyltransferase